MASQYFIRSLLHQAPLSGSKEITRCTTKYTAAAVACIVRLRLTNPHQQFCTIEEIIPYISDADTSLDASILFIKRAVRNGDRWSGDVAFPGGHVEIGESDYDAVCREVKEEVGLDLKNTSRYHWLGRIQDQLVFRRRGTMRIIPHIFVDFIECLEDDNSMKNTENSNVNNISNELVLQPDEVEFAWWVDYNTLLNPSNCKWKTWSIRNYIFETRADVGIGKTRTEEGMRKTNWSAYVTAYVIDGLCRLLQVTIVQFPAIYIGDPVLKAMKDSSIADSSRAVHAKSANDTSHEDSNNSIREEDFHLWGLTGTIVRNIIQQSLVEPSTSTTSVKEMHTTTTTTRVHHEPVHSRLAHMAGISQSSLLASRNQPLRNHHIEASSIVFRDMRVDNKLFTYHLNSWFRLRIFLCRLSRNAIRPPFSWMVPLAVVTYVGSFAIGGWAVGYAMYHYVLV